MNSPVQKTFRLAVVSAGASDASSTKLLAQRASERTATLAASRGNAVTTTIIELRELATDISTALVSQLITPKLQQAITTLGEADGIIASTPVYKAGPSGLFKSFFDVLDNDLLIAKPVVLAATAGTARHSLVADDQMRPMFAYMRTMAVPTSLFAAPEDWGDPELTKRVSRAAFELVVLMESEFSAAIRNESWPSYSHEPGSGVRHPDGRPDAVLPVFAKPGEADLDIDLNTDLMRLATGGSRPGDSAS